MSSQVTRYQSDPGQATAYMIGQLDIIKSRRYAEKELKDNFTLPDFHYQVKIRCFWRRGISLLKCFDFNVVIGEKKMTVIVDKMNHVCTDDRKRIKRNKRFHVVARLFSNRSQMKSN